MASKKKPNSMYREIKSQAYTRKEYMGGIPNSKVIKFETGNTKKEFPITVHLKVKEQCHIRHNALESARVTCNRYLMKTVGRVNFHLIIRVYPHIILRENKLATGAGADRISQGMSEAFGKAVSRAARVRRGQEVMTIHFLPEHFLLVKDSLRKASMKIPSPCSVEVARGQDLLE